MADEKKIVATEDDAQMEVKVVKTGFFTRAGMFLDRHKRKIGIGAAAVGSAVAMFIFVGRHRNDPELYEETVSSGFDTIEAEAEVSDID